MRYVLKQKLLSWANDFVIRSDADEDVFFADGKSLSVGDQLSFQDLSGRELAYIKHKVFAFGPTFEIYRRGIITAVVRKRLTSVLSHRFTVDVSRPNDLEAVGDFADHEYTFRRGARTVATVSKRGFAPADTYGVDIDENEDDVLILAAAVVVDQACAPLNAGRA